MAKLAFLLILVHFIYSKIPDYTLMKRNETLTFKLSTSNSSFFVYLPYEEDYETDEEITPSSIHYIKMDKRLEFNQMYIDKNEGFPDESEFNKSSSEYIMDLETLEVYKNVVVNQYFRLEYEKDINNTVLFVFYIKEQFMDSFDPDETFSIKRVKFNIYSNETIINTQLEPENVNIFGFIIKTILFTPRCLLFTNSPISSLYEYVFGQFFKNSTNINIYTYYYGRDIRPVEIATLIVYNPNNYKQNIFIDFNYNQKDPFMYNSLYWNETNNNKSFHSRSTLFDIYVGQPGLYKIKTSSVEAFKYLFCDNISNIKNLTDLKDIKHYKYLTENFFYISNSHFIILFITTNIAPFIVERYNLEEIEKEINIFNFEYFSISKGNTLNFKLNTTNQNIVLKLLSNNGTVNINNIDYFFNEKEAKVLNISDDHIKINAIDNNFTFAIKLKIPDEFIVYPEFGKGYIIPKNTYYKFLIYKIIDQNYSFIEVRNNYKTFYINYELTAEKNINEIEKGEKKNIYFPYFSISQYKQLFPNASLYLFLYFENLTNNEIEVQTKYYKPMLEGDKFNPVIIDGYMNFLNEDKVNNYFVLPCIGNIQIFKRGYGIVKGRENNKPFKISFRSEHHDILLINSRDSQTPIGFINHYKLDFDEEDYSYIEEKEEKSLYEPEYIFDRLNDTHIRFYIEEIFSNAPEINYTLVITSHKNYNLLEPRCEFFYNFYLKDPPDLNNLEILHFSNDFKNNPNDSRLVYYIDLPNPTKVNLYKKNQILSYKVMGITGPKRKYVKFYHSYFLRICYETCSKCEYLGSDDIHNCTSCIKGKLLHEDNGNCFDKCSLGYYQKENTCKKCNENCESCSKESEKDNNNCLTCNKESKYKYLVNVQDLGKNCVEECPEGTKLDKEKYECVKKNYNYIFIIIGVIGGIILILVIVLLIIKFKKKEVRKEEEEPVMKEMNIKSALTDE